MEPLPIPRDIPKARINSELEAIGRFASGPLKGRFIAVSEQNLDANGNIRAWIFGGKNPFAFSILRNADYVITDIAILDASIVTVERSFGTTVLPGTAIRQFPIDAIKAGRDSRAARSLRRPCALLYDRQYGRHRRFEKRRRRNAPDAHLRR